MRSLLLISLVMSLFATLFGYFFLRKTLRPVHELIETIKAVQNGRPNKLAAAAPGRDELAELSNVFNRMVSQTNILLDSLQDSLDAIAHDLRTPITHIINRSQAALQSQDAHVLREALYGGIDELKGTMNLLNTIMDISEAKAGSLSLKYEKLDLRKLLEECIELFEYSTEEKQAVITLEPFDDVQINADKNRFKQILINLFSNALKYSDAPVSIEVSISQDVQFTHICIKDNGWGIPQDEQNKIWERLFRGDRSRTTQGMGLGLSLVKSIVHLHRGEIHLKSEVGHGSIFTIVLPNR